MRGAVEAVAPAQGVLHRATFTLGVISLILNFASAFMQTFTRQSQGEQVAHVRLPHREGQHVVVQVGDGENHPAWFTHTHTHTWRR